MDPRQIEKILEHMTQNEKESEELGQALLAFNAQFQGLMETLGDALGIQSLKATGEKAEGLTSKVGCLDEKVEALQKHQEQGFDEMLQRMRTLTANSMHKSQGSSYALIHRGQLFIISEDRKEVRAYQSDTHRQCCVYTTQVPIHKLFVYKDEVYRWGEDGKLSTLHDETLKLPTVKELIILDEGLLFLDTEGNLSLLMPTRQLKALAQKVKRFEWLGEGKLVYEADGTYLCDLQNTEEEIRLR